MRTFLVLAICSSLLCGCKSPRSHRTHNEFMDSTPRRLTLLQHFLLYKYCELRHKVTATLGLPKEATADEIRPRAAEYLELPAETSWEAMAEDWRVQSVLTESLRQKIVKIFGFREDTSWLEIKDSAERMRLRIK